MASLAYGPGVFGTLADSGFADPASESARAEQGAAQRFGTDPDLLLVYSSTSGTVDDPAYRRKVQQDLAALPEGSVEAVDTFWTSRSPALVSRDRRSTIAALRLAGGDGDGRERTFDRIRAELESPPAGLRVGITGDLAVDADLNNQAESDLRRAEMLALPALLLLLVLIFRGPVAAALPVASEYWRSWAHSPFCGACPSSRTCPSSRSTSSRCSGSGWLWTTRCSSSAATEKS